MFLSLPAKCVAAGGCCMLTLAALPRTTPSVSTNATVSTPNRSNPAGQFLEFSGPEQFVAGNFENHGKIKITDTSIHFTGAFTEHGHYESDPSSNYFSDWIIGSAGKVTAGPGDRFLISGNFLNGSLLASSWNTALSDLLLQNGGSHTLALAGSDAGATFQGYVQNFAWKSLKIPATGTLTLTDGNATPSAALYVDQLLLEGGLPGIANLTGNGHNIYYNSYDPANAPLAAGTYSLTGGGAIIPVTVDLKITASSRLPSGTLRIEFLGAALRPHRVHASATLDNFTPIATVTAAADGSFTFEDPDPLTRRFYKATYP